MIVYKKAISYGGFDVIVKMNVDSKGVIYPYYSKKMRAKSVMVISITACYNLRRHLNKCKSANFSKMGIATRYVVGRVSNANRLNRSRHSDCGAGINFFRTRREAMAFVG